MRRIDAHRLDLDPEDAMRLDVAQDVLVGLDVRHRLEEIQLLHRRHPADDLCLRKVAEAQARRPRPGPAHRRLHLTEMVEEPGAEVVQRQAVPRPPPALAWWKWNLRRAQRPPRMLHRVAQLLERAYVDNAHPGVQLQRCN